MIIEEIEMVYGNGIETLPRELNALNAVYEATDALQRLAGVSKCSLRRGTALNVQTYRYLQAVVAPARNPMTLSYIVISAHWSEASRIV